MSWGGVGGGEAPLRPLMAEAAFSRERTGFYPNSQ